MAHAYQIDQAACFRFLSKVYGKIMLGKSVFFGSATSWNADFWPIDRVELGKRFWSKEEICAAISHVRFTPKADMCSALAHVR